MPPLTRNKGDRALQVMVANPAMRSHAVATGQQTGTSGTIPGTSSDPTQVATQTGTIQSYPNGPSPNGDTIAGVGHAILNNDGNPVVVMGNLNATQTSGKDLPSNFQDGGFAFVDKSGNLTAGYSQSTGLWGFSSGGENGTLILNQYGDVLNQVHTPFTAVTAGARTHINAFGTNPDAPWCDNAGNISQPGLYLLTLTAGTTDSAAMTGYVYAFDGFSMGQNLIDLAQLYDLSMAYSPGLGTVQMPGTAIVALTESSLSDGDGGWYVNVSPGAVLGGLTFMAGITQLAYGGT